VPFKRILRESLLHFFILAVALFVLYSWVRDDGTRAPDEIVIDASRIAAIESQFDRTWKRSPLPYEMVGRIDTWVRVSAFASCISIRLLTPNRSMPRSRGHWTH
jgi:hypothetical protein